MADHRFPHNGSRPRILANRLALLATCLSLGACADLDGAGLSPLTLEDPTLEFAEAPIAPAAPGQSEIQRATQYWAKQYEANPRSAKPAVAYARNLKALGDKRQALAVLQQAAMFNPTDRPLASEYGRLALEFDQISLAEQLLAHADDPINPDWRVISARGTVLAKQGRYKDAVPLYERALAAAPDQASVLNNLAMAHAMGGDPVRAETLLRKASATRPSDGKVRQNLAMVLALQGRYEESRMASAGQLSPDNARSDAEYLRRIVKIAPKPAPAAPAATPVAPSPVIAARPVTPAPGKQRPTTSTPAWTTTSNSATPAHTAAANLPWQAAPAGSPLKPSAVDTSPAVTEGWVAKVAGR